MATTARQTREARAAEEARGLVVFADGLEDAGFVELARRARVVAAETLWLADELAGARAALAGMEADRDRWRDQRWRETHGEAWPR